MSALEDVKPLELRAKDKDGNTRPADDRFLSASQKRKRDAHVAKVEDALAVDAAEAAAETEPDPIGPVITEAVGRALETEPAETEPAETEPAETEPAETEPAETETKENPDE